MSVSSARMSVYHVYLWCLWWSEEDLGSPGTLQWMAVSPPVGIGNRTCILFKGNMSSLQPPLVGSFGHPVREAAWAASTLDTFFFFHRRPALWGPPPPPGLPFLLTLW